MTLEESITKNILEMIVKKAAEQKLNEEQVQKLIDAAIKSVTTDGLKNASSVFADQLRQQIPEMLSQERKMQAEFEQSLHDRWGKAFDLYDAINILARECGDEYVKQHRKQAAKDN